MVWLFVAGSVLFAFACTPAFTGVFLFTLAWPLAFTPVFLPGFACPLVPAGVFLFKLLLSFALPPVLDIVPARDCSLTVVPPTLFIAAATGCPRFIRAYWFLSLPAAIWCENCSDVGRKCCSLMARSSSGRGRASMPPGPLKLLWSTVVTTTVRST